MKKGENTSDELIVFRDAMRRLHVQVKGAGGRIDRGYTERGGGDWVAYNDYAHMTALSPVHDPAMLVALEAIRSACKELL